MLRQVWQSCLHPTQKSSISCTYSSTFAHCSCQLHHDLDKKGLCMLATLSVIDAIMGARHVKGCCGAPAVAAVDVTVVPSEAVAGCSTDAPFNLGRH